jgi:predicted nucleic acid-binding protein
VSPILVDSSFIVALLGRDERHHEACVDALQSLSAPLVTCEAVITESCYLLRSHPKAVEAVLENVDRGVFGLAARLDELAGTINVFMKRYARVPMDLADAWLVALAERLGTGRILTLDGDFRIYRWRRTKAFEYLVDIGDR